MDDAIDSLIAGYRAFRKGQYRQNEERYQALAARRQQPKALVIACCDSRTDPAMVFQSDPGELFVVRNVANLVPPYEPDSHYHGTSAALGIWRQVIGNQGRYRDGPCRMRRHRGAP